VASARRWSVSDGRTLISVLLVIAAVFLVCASVGAASWVVAALGIAVLAAGVAFYIVSALNSREYAYIPGTAHVVSCSLPPAAGSQGRCELHLVVHTPGQEDVAVKIRETGVPVAKWPDSGATLPILVAVGDPRRVRVLWDRVRTHGEVAQERDEQYVDQKYPAGPVSESVYLDDILDDEEYDAVDVDPTARVIEMDLHGFTIAPDEGPGLSVGIQLDPHSAVAEEAELSPEVDFAGRDLRVEPDLLAEPEVAPEPDVLAESDAHVEPGAEQATPAGRRRPSPRPRRPVEDQGPLPDASGPGAGGVATLPHQPGPDDHDVWRPPAPAQAAPPAQEPPTPRPPGPPVADWTPTVASLRVRHLLAPDPAVPAIPAQAGDEVSDAYLSATTPGARGIHGVGVTLFVANLGRSVAFYRDLLGFHQVDMTLGSAVLEAGDGRIVLRRVGEMAPVDRRLVHLLLEVPDLQAAYDELLLQGVEFVHRPRPVSRYEQLELWSAAFRDPDGHGIALTKWEVRGDD
jgi:resuscitation-promoting factor RpfA